MENKQKFIAINDVDTLYTFKLGGGILGRKVKKGDVVTFLTYENSFIHEMVTCYELLHKLPLDIFKSNFKLING